MESAHITEMVQAVSFAPVENLAVRVHSRLRHGSPGSSHEDQSGSDEQEVDEMALADQSSGPSPDWSPELAPDLAPTPAPDMSTDLAPDMSTDLAPGMSTDLAPDMSTYLAKDMKQDLSPDQKGAPAPGYDARNLETFDASPVEQSEEDTPGNRVNTGHSGIVDGGDSVSKKDLVALLEGFVRIIKTDDPEPGTGIATATGTGTGIDLSHGRGGVIPGEARVDDRTVEIDQLRGLVIEAQDTIIKLLTDRVDDRSRIATLEAQLSLLPDLQAQADRAMSVAVRTEEYRTELTKIKFELDRFRLFRVRSEAEKKKGTIFNRIQKWLFRRPNGRDETLQSKV